MSERKGNGMDGSEAKKPKFSDDNPVKEEPEMVFESPQTQDTSTDSKGNDSYDNFPKDSMELEMSDFEETGSVASGVKVEGETTLNVSQENQTSDVSHPIEPNLQSSSIFSEEDMESYDDFCDGIGDTTTSSKIDELKKKLDCSKLKMMDKILKIKGSSSAPPTMSCDSRLRVRTLTEINRLGIDEIYFPPIVNLPSSSLPELNVNTSNIETSHQQGPLIYDDPMPGVTDQDETQYNFDVQRTLEENIFGINLMSLDSLEDICNYDTAHNSMMDTSDEHQNEPKNQEPNESNDKK